MARYDLALEHFFDELKHHQKNKNTHKIAEVHCNIGVVYDVQGFLAKGLYHYLEAMKGYELEDDKEGLVATLSNLAHIYRARGEHREAIRYFEQASVIEQNHLEIKKPHYFLVNIAEEHTRLGEYTQALQLLREAGRVLNALPIPDDEDLLIWLDMERVGGEIFLLTGQYQEAIRSLEKALDLAIRTDYKEKEGPVQIMLARVYFETKAFTKAEQLLMQARVIAEETSSYNMMRDVYNLLSKVAEARGTYTNAYAYLQKYLAANDSVLSIEGAKRMSEMQAEYDTEKKEATIRLLEQENEIQQLRVTKRETQFGLTALLAVFLLLATALFFNRYRLKRQTAMLLAGKNQELSRVNATKDKFFAILAHDLRNPVSSFHNISQQLKSNIHRINKEDLTYYLDELTRGAQTIHQLLLNLLDWARSQRGEVQMLPEELTPGELVEEATEAVAAGLREKQLRLSTDLRDEQPLVTDRNLVVTVLRNLLSNAVKYTPVGGDIQIETHRNERKYHFSVSDTGIGMTPEELGKLFRIEENTRSIGSPDTKGTGLGLILCKELLDRIGGTIRVSSTPGLGTTFEFTVPATLQNAH
jgi:signal transduction histidine kinase